jgi:RNA polymerase sigma factor (sigma-70 family)
MDKVNGGEVEYSDSKWWEEYHRLFQRLVQHATSNWNVSDLEAETAAQKALNQPTIVDMTNGRAPKRRLNYGLLLFRTKQNLFRGKRLSMSLEEIPEPLTPESTYDTTAMTMFVELLWQEIDDLNDTDRTILVMRLLSGHSYQEIAHLLSVTEANVRQRYSRILRRLRPKLAKWAE